MRRTVSTWSTAAAGKLKNIPTEGVRYFGSPNADIVLVGFGTTLGSLIEAQPKIEAATGKKVGVAQVRVIWPLPAEELQAAIGGAQALVVESNAQGQFAFLMQGGGFSPEKVSSFLKYDGQLITVNEVVNAAEAVLNGEAKHLVTGGGAGRPGSEP